MGVRAQARRGRLVAVGLAAAALGCESDFSGFDDIVDPGPTFVALPGRKVASGRFTHLSIQGTETSGAYVVAWEQPGKHVVVASLDGSGGCRTNASAAEFSRRFPFALETPVDLFVPYVEVRPEAASPDGTTQFLHFANAGCQEPLPPIEFASLPRDTIVPFEDPPGFLATTARQELVFIEPWQSKSTVIATGVTQLTFSQEHMWTVENGAAVVRDRDLLEIARFGTEVTRVAVMLQGGDAMFVDGGNLYSVKLFQGSVENEPTLVDTDVCGLDVPVGWGGFGFSYLKPCAERRLVAYMRGQALAGQEPMPERHELGADAVATPLVLGPAVPFVFYLTNPDPLAERGALWGAKVGEPPERIGENTSLVSVTPMGANERWRMIVDRDENGVGRLVEWVPGETPRELVSGASEIVGSFVLGHVQNGIGEAVLLSYFEDGATEVIATGVPPRGIVEGLENVAILSDYDGTSGKLLVWTPSTAEIEEIAQGVPVRGFELIEELGAILYLRDYDPHIVGPDMGAGLLGVRVLQTADTFDLDIAADRWGIVRWPELGLLYSSPVGTNPGIWFARIK